MTDLRKAAEMALEALEIESKGYADKVVRNRGVITALRQALAQPEQEPVAYLDEGLGAFYWANDYKKGVGFTPLYAVPPHRWSNVTDDCLMEEVRRRGFVIRDAQIGREWVGLTDDEMQEAGRYSYCRGGTSEKLYHIMWNSQPSASVGWCRAELIAFAQTIEAKLKEKNT